MKLQAPRIGDIYPTHQVYKIGDMVQVPVLVGTNINISTSWLEQNGGMDMDTYLVWLIAGIFLLLFTLTFVKVQLVPALLQTPVRLLLHLLLSA